MISSKCVSSCLRQQLTSYLQRPTLLWRSSVRTPTDNDSCLLDLYEKEAPREGCHEQASVATTSSTHLILRISSLYSTESNAKQKSEKEEPDVAPKAADVAESESRVAEEVKQLNDAFSQLKEKYQRSLAENENVRSRLRKEIADTKLYGIQGFCKDLLDVADVMQMAIKSIPEEKLAQETDKTWKSFFEGVRLTDKELHSVFERHGLVVLNPSKGDKFDPYDHEALFETPSNELPPGTIAYIQRVGYKLQGRTIRPAQVGVTPKH